MSDVVTVDKFGKIISSVALSVTPIIDHINEKTVINMVKIPGGEFVMGAPKGEKGSFPLERPTHHVTIISFMMSTFSVTQAQWKAIMGSNPSRFKGENRPVEGVSWYEAVEFCQKLSQQSDKNYRLPSEAEWEYACRAGTTTPFHFGETITTKLANYDGNYAYGSGPRGDWRRQTTEVGSFPSNAFGLHDMHGNVAEWCQDTWFTTYKDAPTDGSARLGFNKGDSKVLRGFSLWFTPGSCRSEFRRGCFPHDGYPFMGFRVVYSAPGNVVK